MRRLRLALVAPPVGLVLAACGGGEGPTDPGDEPPQEVREVMTDPSFSKQVVEIFVRRGCTASQCHGGGQGGLTLTGTASVSYGNLVSVSASGAPGEIRVIPGNAQDSYLVKKLEGRQSVGTRMPVTGAALDSVDLGNVRNWIDRGALNN
jgi:hypothetical protein